MTEPDRDEQVSIGRGFLRLTHHTTSGGIPWAEGEYVHRAGIVSILRQSADRGFPNGYTRLDAVIDGKLAIRTWEREWADRSIPKLARQLLGAD